jgi:hypothetical protein
MLDNQLQEKEEHISGENAPTNSQLISSYQCHPTEPGVEKVHAVGHYPAFPPPYNSE